MLVEAYFVQYVRVGLSREIDSGGVVRMQIIGHDGETIEKKNFSKSGAPIRKIKDPNDKRLLTNQGPKREKNCAERMANVLER